MGFVRHPLSYVYGFPPRLSHRSGARLGPRFVCWRIVFLLMWTQRLGGDEARVRTTEYPLAKCLAWLIVGCEVPVLPISFQKYNNRSRLFLTWLVEGQTSASPTAAPAMCRMGVVP